MVSWVTGGCLLHLFTRIPPGIWPPRHSQSLWKHKSPVSQRLFWVLTVPCAGFALGMGLYGGYQQFWYVGADSFTATTAVTHLLLALWAAVLLTDPTAIFRWIAQDDTHIYIRRVGWSEQAKRLQDKEFEGTRAPSVSLTSFIFARICGLSGSRAWASLSLLRAIP